MEKGYMFKYWNIKLLPLFVIVIGVITIGCVSCDKPITEEPEDYREKWVGTYKCKYYNNNSIIEEKSVYVTSIEDSMLNIIDSDISSEYVIIKHDVKVKHDGNFKISGTLQFGSGNFYKDSLYIHIIQAQSGGAGHIYYHGKKIKN